jgi:hypothetical protein
MHLQNASREVLQQLIDLTRRLDARQYGQPLPVLSGRSVGSHVRHIIEFYDLLLQSPREGRLNYNQRPHSHQLEESPVKAAHKLEEIVNGLDSLPLDSPLLLETSLSPKENDTIVIPSNYPRELLYNLEHAIHHMATIRIGIGSLCPELPLPKQFGVAQATIRHQKNQVAGMGR